MKANNIDQIPHEKVQSVVQEARETTGSFELFADDFTAKLDGETEQLEITWETDNACQLQRVLSKAKELGLVAADHTTGGYDGCVRVKMRKNL